MLNSAEVRWFWRKEPPTELKDWFHDPLVHGCPPGGGPPSRDDIYLITESDELGIKVRGVKGRNSDGTGVRAPLELKGKVGEHRQTEGPGPSPDPIQLWCKWTVPGIDLGQARTCRVSKTRWLRRFETSGNAPVEVPLGREETPLDHRVGPQFPVRGCNVELTEVRLDDGQVWWSFCIEAYGEMGTVVKDMRSTTDLMYRRGNFPDLSTGSLFSYPEWLAQLRL